MADMQFLMNPSDPVLLSSSHLSLPVSYFLTSQLVFLPPPLLYFPHPSLILPANTFFSSSSSIILLHFEFNLLSFLLHTSSNFYPSSRSYPLASYYLSSFFFPFHLAPYSSFLSSRYMFEVRAHWTVASQNNTSRGRKTFLRYLACCCHYKV